MGFARNADGIALILIAESAKQVIKSIIHLGNPGLLHYGVRAHRDIEIGGSERPVYRYAWFVTLAPTNDFEPRLSGSMRVSSLMCRKGGADA